MDKNSRVNISANISSPIIFYYFFLAQTMSAGSVPNKINKYKTKSINNKIDIMMVVCFF